MKIYGKRGVTLTREGEKIYPKVVEYIECERLMMDVADEIAGLSTLSSNSSVYTTSTGVRDLVYLAPFPEL